VVRGIVLDFASVPGNDLVIVGCSLRLLKIKAILLCLIDDPGQREVPVIFSLQAVLNVAVVATSQRLFAVLRY
jgi:hypothetical protein